METIAARYYAPNTLYQYYMTEFDVACPKCQRLAIITAGHPHFFNNAQLKCGYCGHSETSNNLVRYKVSVKENCDTCGKLISKAIPSSKAPIDAFAITCPTCNEIRIYKPSNESYRPSYSNSNADSDPIFGVPLWLQGSIRGNLFWAYNRQHLHAIKEYVGAKLRERQTTTHTTMVEKLPQFIKESKNREAVLKLIEKLERK